MKGSNAMWISLFDFIPDFMTFKSYLEEQTEFAFEDLDAFGGALSQVSFRYKGKLFAMHIRPEFRQRKMSVMVFEVEHSHYTIKNRYTWNDKCFHSDHASFFQSLILLFKNWLVDKGFDGFASLSRRNFPALEGVDFVVDGDDRLLATGPDSKHIASLIKRLPVRSIRYNKGHANALEKSYFYCASMVVRAVFYPSPGLDFVHYTYAYGELDNVEDMYTFKRCINHDELDQFLLHLDTLELERLDFIHSCRLLVDGRQNYQVDVIMDSFVPKYFVALDRHTETTVDTKEEALELCSSHYSAAVSLENAEEVLKKLILSFDDNAVFDTGSMISFFGLSTSFSFKLKVSDAMALSFHFYFKNVDGDFSFESDRIEELTDRAKTIITIFAKKHRLASLLN
jgi:hypothetical protein